jgi:hypothetical protein
MALIDLLGAQIDALATRQMQMMGRTDLGSCFVRVFGSCEPVSRKFLLI